MDGQHPPRSRPGARAAHTDAGAAPVLHTYVQGHGRTIAVITLLPDGRSYEAVYPMLPGEGSQQACERISPLVCAQADRVLDGV